METQSATLVLLMIAIGGALGSAGRYLLSGIVRRRTPKGYPWGTLAVNGLGSLGLGVALAGLGSASGYLVSFLVVGLIGSFTTFSTFAYEIVELVRSEAIGRATSYAVVSVVIGLISVLIGIWLGGLYFGG